MIAPTETPFFSMTRKTSSSAVLSETVADTLRKPRLIGGREGQGASQIGSQSSKRQRFGVYQHKLFDNWAVSDVQQAVAQKGGNAVTNDEKLYAKQKAIRAIKTDGEAICLSDQEMQGGSDDEMKTRGGFKWVQTAAQSVNPVPDDFRPPATSIITLGSDILTETNSAAGYKSLNGVLKSMKQVYGKKIDVEGFFGDDLCEMVDNFSRLNAGTTESRYNVMENGNGRTITLSVQIFDTTFARLHVIPDQFVRCDANGNGKGKAGLLVVPEEWEIQWLEELVSQEMPDTGGGPSGWIRGFFALGCRNPKGQGAILDS